jgi:ferritin-like metal-binding protein YciE
MKLKTLHDLFIHELKDLYSAETQLTKALPKMAKAATHEDLKSAFQEHLEQTKTHVERLEQIAEACECTLTGHKCKAMEGLIAEGSELISEDADESVRDAGLIGAGAAGRTLRNCRLWDGPSARGMPWSHRGG